MNIYVSCPLTHVPRNVFEKYTSFIHRLAEAARLGGQQHVSYALVNSDPQLADKPFDERARLCYLWDRDLVERADLVIAEVSYPAIGVGIELQIAETKDIPIILCFKRSAETRTAPVDYENPDHTRHTLQIGEGYVSLMALGLSAIFKVIAYDREEEAIANVVEAIRVITKDEGHA